MANTDSKDIAAMRTWTKEKAEERGAAILDPDTYLLQYLPICAICGQIISPNSADSTTSFRLRRDGFVGRPADLHIDCARDHADARIRALLPAHETIIDV